MIVAFDIGGSHIRAGRSVAPGAVDLLGMWPTPCGDFAALAGVLADAVAMAGPRARALALSLPGVVDPATGRARIANIPCLDGRDVAAALGAVLGLPVIVANDAACFVLAEARTGAARGHDNVFGIILGTGVGGGLVIGGRLVRGAGGYAGEWGHGPVLRTEARDHRGAAVHVPHFPCGCGQAGCVDTVGGARGIERLWRHITGTDRPSTGIVAALEAGEEAALRVAAVWADLVSAPLAVVLNTVGASAVPVAGGLANADRLVAALDRMVRSRLLRRAAGPLLVRAGHRDAPGLIGAAMLGWESAGDGPRSG